MEYSALITELTSLADPAYRAFHAGLLKDPAIALFGVRMPALRRLARTLRAEWEDVLSFPDEFYEVTLLKCLVLGLQPYEIFASRLEQLLPHIDNWATCDCFDAPCIKGHRAEFLAVISRLRTSTHTFTARYALVQLLRYYCEEEYFPYIFESVTICDHADYYVSMAAAWLVAEVLVRAFDAGLRFLEAGTLPAVTHNRAIRKACESLRLGEEQKALLRTKRRVAWTTASNR